MGNKQSESGKKLLAITLILAICLAGCITYILIGYLQKVEQPCFRGYHQLNKDPADPTPKYILLMNDTASEGKNKIALAKGGKIPRADGKAMINDFQGTLSPDDKITTRYVDYDLSTMFDYIAYLFNQGNTTGHKNLGVRVFTAQSKEIEPSSGKHRTTTLFAPVASSKTQGKDGKDSIVVKFLLSDWMFYDEGSICPPCAVPSDPSGLNGIITTTAKKEQSQQ